MIEQKLYSERGYDRDGQLFLIEKIVHHKRTEFQEIMIFENSSLGRVMTLDGVVQAIERDEFIYHEMMVHVPLFSHGNVRNVLIIGGGDGAILREVVKHKEIKSITLVEADVDVISLCAQFLPNHSNGSFADDRLKLIIDDGMRFISKTTQVFDVIFSDYICSVRQRLESFTLSFYDESRRILSERGIFVSKNGVYPLQDKEIVHGCRKLNGYFKYVGFYQVALPYCGGRVTFSWATDALDLRWQSAEVIRERFEKSGLTCRHYNPDMHVLAFNDLNVLIK